MREAVTSSCRSSCHEIHVTASPEHPPIDATNPVSQRRYSHHRAAAAPPMCQMSLKEASVGAVAGPRGVVSKPPKRRSIADVRGANIMIPKLIRPPLCASGKKTQEAGGEPVPLRPGGVGQRGASPHDRHARGAPRLMCRLAFALLTGSFPPWPVEDRLQRRVVA